MPEELMPDNYQNATEALQEVQSYFESAVSGEIVKKLQLIFLYHHDVGKAYSRLSAHVEQFRQEIEDLKEKPNRLVASEDAVFLRKYQQLYEADIEPTVAYLAAQIDGVREPMLTKLMKMTYQLTDELVDNIKNSLAESGKTDGLSK
jgi:hypothetical protein